MAMVINAIDMVLSIGLIKTINYGGDTLRAVDI